MAALANHFALAIGLMAALQVAAHAQPEHSSFDAASIRPAAPPRTWADGEGGNRNRIEYTPTSLTMRNVGVSDCIQWAYDVPFFQIAGTNLSRDGYDIFARTGSPVPVSQLRTMLQDLLAKRFALALHRETREQPTYELVIAKGGPRLPAPKPDAGAVHTSESLPRIENGAFVFHDMTVGQFAAMLPQLRGVELPVIDRTGIAGTYDLALKGAPEVTRQGDAQGLFDIIQEQLGLRLQPAKAPVQMLVIDHAGKPVEN